MYLCRILAKISISDSAYSILASISFRGDPQPKNGWCFVDIFHLAFGTGRTAEIPGSYFSYNFGFQSRSPFS